MADEQTETPEGEEKPKSKLPLIIGVVLLVVAAAGGGAYFGGAFDPPPEPGEAANAEPVPEPKIPAQYVQFKPEFVANYKVNGRTNFLKVSINVLVREDDVRLAVDQHMPSLRNAMVMLFGAADFAALKTLEGKEALREEALKALQEIMLKELGKPGIEQVLFTEFVLQ